MSVTYQGTAAILRAKDTLVYIEEVPSRCVNCGAELTLNPDGDGYHCTADATHVMWFVSTMKDGMWVMHDMDDAP